jgi:hypothetical protein
MAESKAFTVSRRTLLIGGMVAMVLIVGSFFFGRATGEKTTSNRDLVSPFYTPCTKTNCAPVKAAVTPPAATSAPTTTSTTVPPITTTTLPAPLALGSQARLTVPSNPGSSQVTVSISRTWIGVNPTFDPGPPGGLAHALKFVNAPAKLQWIGIAFAMVNTGPQEIGMISNGRYQPYLVLVVSGQGPGITSQEIDGIAQLGFYAGVAGCPFPFANNTADLGVGADVVGCLAVPVPVGLSVSSIGFDLSSESGESPNAIALWNL